MHLESRSPAVEHRRPEISIYWREGCSSCLRLKTFIEHQGLVYESVNVSQAPERQREVVAAGVRGIPVVRRGDKFLYALYLDDLPAFLGLTCEVERLSKPELLDRWLQVLECAQAIVHGFDEAELTQRAVPTKDRALRDLCQHVFQIPDAFLKSVGEGLVVEHEHTHALSDIGTREQLLVAVDAAVDRCRRWIDDGGAAAIPDRLPTSHGPQGSLGMLERTVWHTAHHSRQLDIIAVSRGREYRIAPSLYASLPMPGGIWDRM
jgi:glutaredoxin